MNFSLFIKVRNPYQGKKSWLSLFTKERTPGFVFPLKREISAFCFQQGENFWLSLYNIAIIPGFCFTRENFVLSLLPFSFQKRKDFPAFSIIQLFHSIAPFFRLARWVILALSSTKSVSGFQVRVLSFLSYWRKNLCFSLSSVLGVWAFSFNGVDKFWLSIFSSA